MCKKTIIYIYARASQLLLLYHRKHTKIAYYKLINLFWIYCFVAIMKLNA